MSRANELQRREAEMGFMEIIEQRRPQLQKISPRGFSADRMIQIARLAFSVTPELQQCTSASLVASIALAARYGLEIGGFSGEAYLIPRYNGKTKRKEATLQIGYRGLEALAYRSGKISFIKADVVKEGDAFEYEDGLEPRLRHVKALRNRGEAYAAWAAAKTTDGQKLFVVLSKEEIEGYRARGGSRGFSPWETDWDAMASKTAVRRLAKFLPMASELSQASQLDEQCEIGVAQAPSLDVMVKEAELIEGGDNDEG